MHDFVFRLVFVTDGLFTTSIIRYCLELGTMFPVLSLRQFVKLKGDRSNGILTDPFYKILGNPEG